MSAMQITGEADLRAVKFFEERTTTIVDGVAAFVDVAEAIKALIENWTSGYKVGRFASERSASNYIKAISRSKLTVEQRGALILLLPDLSTRAAAEIVGTSKSEVDQARAGAAPVPNGTGAPTTDIGRAIVGQAEAKKVKGRDGKSYPARSKVRAEPPSADYRRLRRAFETLAELTPLVPTVFVNCTPDEWAAVRTAGKLAEEALGFVLRSVK